MHQFTLILFYQPFTCEFMCLQLEEDVGKFGLLLSLMSKVFMNDKGITSGYDDVLSERLR